MINLGSDMYEKIKASDCFINDVSINLDATGLFTIRFFCFKIDDTDNVA